MRHLITLTAIIFAPFFVKGQATMLDDQEMQKAITQGLDKMYNMEFSAADKFFDRVKEKYPNHPAYDLLQSMSLTWEMIYDNSFKERSEENLDHLERAIEQAHLLLESDSNDPEGIFFILAGRASLALYYAQKDETFKSVNEARKAYSLMKKADKWKDELMDFNFPVGLYNYYVVQYPENHPVFKPFMFFFMKGDKQEGLRLLDKCSKNGVYSATESTYYLSHIYLRYEEDFEKSLTYSAPLTKEYPENINFKINYCEALIGAEKYKEAEYVAYELYKTDKVFAQIAAFTYYGHLNERYFNNPEKAKSYYQQSIQLAKDCQYPIEDFLGQSYAGLGRYYHRKGETQNAVKAYEKCLEQTDYLSLMKEAEEYLEKYD